MIGLHPDCPPGATLLADHLDAALAIGEELLSSSLPARADLDAESPDTAPEALDAFVRSLMQHESALLLRLLQARRLAPEIARADGTLKAAAALFRAQTDVLQDLVEQARDHGRITLARPGDSHAYIRSRGLIPAEAAAPSPFEGLAVGEDFKVGAVARLGDVLDLVAALLDLLDARFGLYAADVEDEPVALLGDVPGEAQPADPQTAVPPPASPEQSAPAVALDPPVDLSEARRDAGTASVDAAPPRIKAPPAAKPREMPLRPPADSAASSVPGAVGPSPSSLAKRLAEAGAMASST